LHLDTVQLELFQFKNTNIKRSKAERNGGVIAVEKMMGEVRISDGTIIEDFFVDQM